ncbi:hypothetical protein AWQ21_08220 [Picosynechococcus sp. PCC 7003]|uniref:hypothetical protein n=1 Tax=Picosynechococcus sp. PCC 7003 TaxID=374981 RepID=UPI000810EC47|nr:hypothetical protein [Picosynechococcus sp. PCC 7003]ANV84368.1 hypothetical protein AWQ21_08220 [Picosynechococcus sp. PCC 7003]
MANTYEAVIERWKQLPSDYSEVKLEKHFIDECIWPSLGLNFTQIESQIKIGSGLKPDYLIFSDDDKRKPLITVEVKKRDQILAESADEFFIDKCKENKYYQESVGYKTDGNGIQQYLNKESVDGDKLPPYGRGYASKIKPESARILSKKPLSMAAL